MKQNTCMACKCMEVLHCPDKIHRIPLHRDRLTNKLQTPQGMGSAALTAACLFKGRQPKLPRNGIIKVVKMKNRKKTYRYHCTYNIEYTC